MGKFEMTAPDGVAVNLTSQRAQALVALLALENGRSVGRPQIWALLWEDRAEAQARNSLRQAFSALRKVCGVTHPFPFRVDATEASIVPDLVRTDIQRIADRAEVMRDEGEPLFRYQDFLLGVTLPGAEFQAWLVREREHWRELFVRAALEAVGTAERTSDLPEASRRAEMVLEADPFNEAAYRAQIRERLAVGDRVGALRKYQQCRDRLRSDLQIDPGPETQALYHQISAAISVTAPQNEPLPPPAVPDREKPSIVVLPFTAHGGVGSFVEDFAAGLTESLTDDLSRFHDLHVAASRSAFAYQQSAVDVASVCRELAVRFALSGRVQSDGGRLRVQARLVDGSDGRVVWTERYDRTGDDLWDLRDELSEVIVATLANTYGGRLRKAFQKSPRAVSSVGSEAYDCFVRGIDMVDQWTIEALEPGTALLQRAIELDPGFAKAHAKLSFCDVIAAHEGWAPEFDAALADGYRKARDAIAADDSEPWGHWALSYCHLFAGKHDLCLHAIEHALRLNPNDADIIADLGLFQGCAGQADRGVNTLKDAMRRNPHYPDWYVLQLVQVLFDAHRYAEVIKTHGRMRITSPLTDLYLAASHAALGDLPKAQRIFGKTRAEAPEVVDRIRNDPRRLPYRRHEDKAHFLDHLDRAERG